MPGDGCSHHGPPRARKVFGKTGGPAPNGRRRHDYEPMDGWAGCSCGTWTRVGAQMTTKQQWREHVRTARRTEREQGY